MSQSVPNNPGFFDTVQICFMELTGRSVMLSGRDLEKLVEWREQGAPARAICKGLKSAVEAMPEEDPPRDVYACRDWIVPYVDQARERQVGGHGADAEEGADEQSREQADPSGLFKRALDKIERAGRRADDEAIRRVYRHAWRRVRQLADERPSDRWEQLTAVEEGLVEGYYRALDRAEQDEIAEQIDAKERGLIDGMSAEARRDHLRARRRRILMDDYELVSLIE
jgi:hypothetical protein